MEMNRLPATSIALRIAAAITLLAWSPTARSAGLTDLVAPEAKVEKVAGGFKFTEGPAYGPQGFLVFSDIPANRIVELAADGTPRDFLNPSDEANGLAFDGQGRLYACQGKARRVVRIEFPGGKDGEKR